MLCVDWTNLQTSLQRKRIKHNNTILLCYYQRNSEHFSNERMDNKQRSQSRTDKQGEQLAVCLFVIWGAVNGGRKRGQEKTWLRTTVLIKDARVTRITLKNMRKMLHRFRLIGHKISDNFLYQLELFGAKFASFCVSPISLLKFNCYKFANNGINNFQCHNWNRIFSNNDDERNKFFRKFKSIFICKF